jgi:hypothetical protein
MKIVAAVVAVAAAAVSFEQMKSLSGHLDTSEEFIITGETGFCYTT